METGNVIAPVEKYQTRKGENEKKPCYDKVLKILGLTEKELDENGDK